jgi:ketosteroid isomerase-like protein
VVIGFVEAVNHGQMDKALDYYAPSVTIVDDLAPYRWTGPGAGGAWLTAMDANAKALAITGIEMRVTQVTRVEVAADHAYAIAPGRLSFTYKDGHRERAEGQLAFTLVKTPRGWKIDTQTWAGPAPDR